MMGVCFECLVEMYGVSNKQACMLEVTPGMRVRQPAAHDSWRSRHDARGQASHAHDCIVIRAGPAELSAALTDAGQGLQLLLLDGQARPSFKSLEAGSMWVERLEPALRAW